MCFNVNIPDELAKEAGITQPREALIELACALFDRGKLHLWPAAQLAGLDRVEFEDELHKRGIAAYRITLEDFEEDLRTIRWLEQQDRGTGGQ